MKARLSDSGRRWTVTGPGTDLDGLTRQGAWALDEATRLLDANEPFCYGIWNGATADVYPPCVVPAWARQFRLALVDALSTWVTR